MPKRIPTTYVADYLGKLFNRDRILDKTIKVAYGPDQPLNVHSNDQMGDLIPYVAPHTWADSGSILAMPQVVRLFGSYPYSYQYFEVKFSSLNYYDPPGVLNCSWGSDYDESASWTPIEGEAERLTQLMQDVKTQIETLRPNRTWVVIQDHQYNPDGSISSSTDIGQAYGPYNIISIIPCPIPDQDFIGVDFLMISFGIVAVSTVPDGDYDLDHLEVLNEATINSAISTLKTNKKNFYNYHSYVYIYEPDINYDTLLPPYTFTFKPGTDYPGFGSLLFPLGVFYPPGWPTVPDPSNPGQQKIDERVPSNWGPTVADETTLIYNTAFIDVTNAEEIHGDFPSFYRNTIFEQEDNITHLIDLINEGLEGTEDTVEFVGSATDATKANIIAKIASYFNFDPITGKDIVPTPPGP